MNAKELKEVIELYEAVRETGLSVQEFLHYVELVTKKI